MPINEKHFALDLREKEHETIACFLAEGPLTKVLLKYVQTNKKLELTNNTRPDVEKLIEVLPRIFRWTREELLSEEGLCLELHVTAVQRIVKRLNTVLEKFCKKERITPPIQLFYRVPKSAKDDDDEALGRSGYFLACSNFWKNRDLTAYDIVPFEEAQQRGRKAAQKSLEAEHNQTTSPSSSFMALEERLEPRLNFDDQMVATSRAANLYNYKIRELELVGRQTEMDELGRFLGTPERGDRPFSWWIIVGSGGMGKSRLALELCATARSRGWAAGALDPAQNLADWACWTPEQPTLIVIDYAARRIVDDRDTENLGYRIEELTHRCSQFPVPLRMLLIERDPAASWHQRLWSECDIRHRCFWSQVRGRSSMNSERNEPASTDMLSSGLAARDDYLKEYRKEYLFLQPLGEDAIHSIFDHVLDNPRHPVLENWQSTYSTFVAIDEQRRPLFAAFAAEAARETGELRRWHLDELIRYTIGRYKDKIWAPSGVKLNSPSGRRHLNLLALAVMCQGLASLPHEEDILPTRKDFHTDWHQTLCGAPVAEDGTLFPLEPDVLGECFVLTHLASGPDIDSIRKVLLQAAWRERPERFGQFLCRATDDFPGNPILIALLEASPHSVSASAAWAHAVGYTIFSYTMQHPGLFELGSTLCDSLWNKAQTVYRDSVAVRHHAALGLLSRGTAHWAARREKQAIADYSAIVDASWVALKHRSQALCVRAKAYSQMTPPQVELALSDYSTVIDLPKTSAELATEAHFDQGTLLIQRCPSRIREAIAHFSQVIDHSTNRQMKIGARINRAHAYKLLDPPHIAEALDDYSEIIADPLVSLDDWVNAISNQGLSYLRETPPQVTKAIDSFEKIIHSPNVSTSDKMWAKLYFGQALGFNPSRLKEAIKILSEVADNSDSSSKMIVRALIEKGVVFSRMSPPEHHEEAISSFTSATEIPDISVDDLALALFNRGATHGSARPPNTKNAMRDYLTVIGMQDVPAEDKAEAHLNLANLYLEMGQEDKAIAECSAVIEISGATTETIAKAYGKRGAIRADDAKPDFSGAIRDWFLVVTMPNTSEQLRVHSCVSIVALWDSWKGRDREATTDDRVIVGNCLLLMIVPLLNTSRMPEANDAIARLAELAAVEPEGGTVHQMYDGVQEMLERIEQSANGGTTYTH